MGLDSFRFINREAVYNVDCSNPCNMSITWVAIEFIPLLSLTVNKITLRLK